MLTTSDADRAVSTTEVSQLAKQIGDYFASNARLLPWRQPSQNKTFDPYHILVSEIMLQQTQVQRVLPKYQLFLQSFPTIQTLAKAKLASVLGLWSGLGYNRRAKYLHDVAKILVNIDQPWQLSDLVKLKGIGHNTAAATLTYAYNQPHVFIETNVRSVYLHYFFQNKTAVTDNQILPYLKASLELEQQKAAADFRKFYWALMDYGSYLKTTTGNASRRSQHYKRQSKFNGSKRQLRGQVLKTLLKDGPTTAKLQRMFKDERLPSVLTDLQTEGLITKHKQYYRLT